MSTFNHPNTTAASLSSSSSKFYSPDNIRSIFYTNLLLLGIQEHALQPESAETHPSQEISKALSNSRHGVAPLAFDTRLHPQPPQQHILIAAHGFGTNTSRPLELNKHVFAKGHQSTKALEFVLWFLFTRLNKSLARDRFKECWPILDRHDAREFRNVAFKWLDELRKEGCFGIGHNIHHSSKDPHVAVATTSTGLGLFLPTIRRSYLDEAIGERTEQLVLILSNYVLSRIAAEEINRIPQQQNDKSLLDLASQVPEHVQAEDALLATIESHIARRSQLFAQDSDVQDQTRKEWKYRGEDLSIRLRTLQDDLAGLERQRQLLSSSKQYRQSEHGNTSDSHTVDPALILDVWKSAMQSLENGNRGALKDGGGEPFIQTKEQNVIHQPYRRLLTTIRVDGHSSDTKVSAVSTSTETDEAILFANTLGSIFSSSTRNRGSSPERIRNIRTQIQQSVNDSNNQEHSQRRNLSAAFKDKALGNRANLSSVQLPPSKESHEYGKAPSTLAIDQSAAPARPAPKRSIFSSALLVKDTSKDSSVSAATPTTSDTKSPNPALPIKSLLQQRFGASRKRRQSFGSPPERSTSLPFSPRRQDGRSNGDDEIIQQKEMYNIFNMDANEPPGTPSKRRRVDSVEQELVGRRTSFVFDLEVPTKEDATQRYNPLRTSQSSTTIRSPKLTLDDLRAPTPKSIKTKGVDTSISMPIMLLHTPQQKKLFEMETSQIAKPARPFPVLTPSSTSDSVPRLPAISPRMVLKRSPFSSSIFTRFEPIVDPMTVQDQQPPSGFTKPADQIQSTILPSPFIVASGVKKSTPPLRASLRRSRGMSTSSIVKHMLTGNSVVLDRIYGKSSDQPEAPVPDDTVPQPLAEAGDRGDVGEGDRDKVQESDSTSIEAPPERPRKAIATATVSAVDLNASRNPWGRPPSWKPSSPKMVDMERRRQLDRAHRSTPKPMPLSFDSLSQSAMGSLKVSVYGRASVSIPSSSSVSFSSSSSLSSKSFNSDSGLWASQAKGLFSQDAVQEDDNAVDIGDEDDTREFSPPPVSPIRDTPLDSLFPSFGASMASTQPRATMSFAQSIRTQRKNTSGSAGGSVGVKPPATAPTTMTKTAKATTTESVARRRPSKPATASSAMAGYLGQVENHMTQQRQHEAARNDILGQPIEEDEFMARNRNRNRGDEDDTILNHALQPIFDGKGGSSDSAAQEQRSVVQEFEGKAAFRHTNGDKNHGESDDGIGGGLFDEVMPETLDLDEALWDTTDIFS
ncbi:hypothetical protein BGZ99_002614 [Dissophora globulifera]|uniref:HAUS augmin-like complex subunit 6 N-terminal domain-containing protein n=1 Tax=Dissophora globulifera TaxID=979702 RepID=A0A9P6RS90_9FUNG|nr:hypothetical protein BGZ99_002614 [Dissophora globulifera]